MLLSRSLLLAAVILLTTASSAIQAADGWNDKAQRYHAVLLKRPNPGAVFERFYDAWMTTGSVEELQAFLAQRAQTSASDRCLYAFFLTRIGDDLAAAEQFRQITEQGKASADIRLQHARIATRLLDFSTAINTLEQGLPKATGQTAERMTRLLGRLLIRTGKREAGLAAWQRLVDARPGDQDLEDDLLASLAEEGLFAIAIERCIAIRQACKEPYRQAVLGLRLGDMYDRDGRRDEAIATYAALLPKVGVDSWLEKEILAQIERVYRRDDDLPGLASQLASLVKTEPHRSGLRRRHAQTLIAQGETEPALASFRAVLAHHPGRNDLRLEFADMLVAAERPAAAAEIIKELASVPTADPELAIRLAELQHQAGDVAAASAAIEAYLERSDGGVFAHLRAARKLKDFGLKEAESAIYAKMLEGHGDDPEAVIAWAKQCFSTDQIEQGRRALLDLAVKAPAELTTRIVRTLSDHQQSAAGYDLLGRRLSAFPEHAGLLEQHVNLALDLDHHDEALASARRRLALATSRNDIKRSTQLVIRAARRGDQLGPLQEDLLKADQHSLGQRCLVAELLAIDGRMADAMAQLQPDDAAPLAEAEVLIGTQIDLLSSRQSWAKAAALLAELISRPGGRTADRLRRLAAIKQRLGRYDGALQTIEEWKRIATHDHQAWLAEARLHRDRLNHQACVRSLKAASARFPDIRDIGVQLAQAYETAGKHDDARRIYRRMYEQTEDLSQRLTWVRRLAQLADNDGTTAALVARFEERRHGNRRSIAPLLALAEIHAVSHNYRARRDVLLEATRLRPDDGDILQEIARIEVETGDQDAALATLRRVEELVGKDRTKRRQLINTYLHHGFDEEAMRLIDAMAEDLADPRVVESIAKAFAVQNEWQRCSQLLERALIKHADDQRLIYLAGIAAEESDQLPQALDHFVRLVDMDGDPPAVATINPANWQRGQRNQWRLMMARHYPTGTLDIMMQASARWQSYSYQQQQHNGRRSRMMAGSGIGPIQPSDREEAQSFALAHIATIRDRLDDAAQTELDQVLSATGVPHITLRSRIREYNKGPWIDLLATAPYRQDLAVQAVRVMMSSRRGQMPMLDADEAKRLHQLFAEPYPLLAWQAALQAEDPALAKQATDQLAGVDQADDGLIMSLAQWRQQSIHQGEMADEAVVAAINQALTRWYPAVIARAADQPTMINQRLTDSLRRALLQEADTERIVMLLNAETSMAGITAVNPMMMFNWGRRGRRQAQVLRALPLPPQGLATVNANSIRQILAQADPLELEPRLAEINNPLVAAFAALACDRHDRAATILQSLITAETPNRDALIFAAALAADADDHATFLGHFNQVRYLTMPRDQRQAVDGALVELAIRSEHEGLIEAARQAALRLRQTVLQSRDRFALVDAMVKLGLTDEAKKLEEEALTAAATPVVASGRPASARTELQKIGDLIKRGKRDAALIIALRIGRNWVRQDVTGQTAMHHRNYWEIDQWRKNLQQNKMVDDVIGRSAKQAGTNARRRIEHAILLRYLGKDDEALALHETLLKEQPDHRGLRQSHVTLLLDHDSNRAQQALIAAPVEGRAAIINAWLGRLRAKQQQRSQGDVQASTFRIITVVCELLEQETSTNPLPQQALGQVLNLLAGHINGGRGARHISQLYTANGIKEVIDRDHEMVNKRCELHQRFCRALLRYPQFAGDALARLLYVEEQTGGAGLPDAIATAERILIGEATFKPPKHFTAPGFHTSSSSGSDRVGRFRSPAEILIAASYQADELASATRLLTALQGLHDKHPNALAVSTDFASLLKLYQVDEADFATAAAAFHRAIARQRNNPRSAVPGIYHGDISGALIDCLTQRGLTTDLGPVALAQAGGDSAHWHQSSYQLARDWLILLHQRDDLTTIRSFLDELERTLFGKGSTRDKRLARVAKAMASGSYSVTQEIAKVQAIVETLSKASMGRPKLALLSLQWLSDRGIPDNQGWKLTNEVQGVFNQRNPTRTIELLQMTRLLDDATTFADLYHQRFHSGNSLLLMTLQYGSGSYTEKLVKALAALPEADHFGVRLLHGLAKRDSTMVLQAIGTARAILDQRDDLNTAKLLATVNRYLGRVSLAEDADAVAKAGWQWYTKELNGSTEDQVASILAARSWSDLNINYHDQQAIAPMLTTLLHEDSDRFATVLQKMTTLAERGSRSNEISYHRHDGGNFASQFASTIIDSGSKPTLATLTRLLNFVQDGDGLRIPQNRNWHYQIRNILRAQALNNTTVDDQIIVQAQTAMTEAGYAGDWFGLLGFCVEQVERLQPARLHKLASKGVTATPGSAAWAFGLASSLQAAERPELARYLTQVLAVIPGDETSGTSRRRDWLAEMVGQLGHHLKQEDLRRLPALSQRAISLLEHTTTAHQATTRLAQIWRKGLTGSDDQDRLKVEHWVTSLFTRPLGRSHSQPFRSRDQEALALHHEAMRLAYATDNRPLCLKILRHNSYVGDEIATWRMMIEAGDLTGAAKAINASKNRPYPRLPKGSWEHDVDDQLIELFAKIKNDGIQLMAKTALICLPGPDPAARRRRIRNLASTMDFTNVTDPNHRWFIVERLAADANDIILPVAKAGADAVDLTAALKDEGRSAVAPLLLYFTSCLQAGDAGALALVNRLDETCTAIGGNRSQVGTVLDGFDQWMEADGWHGRTDAVLQQALAVGQRIQLLAEPYSRPHRAEHISDVILLALLTGGPEAVAKWRAKVKADHAELDEMILNKTSPGWNRIYRGFKAACCADDAPLADRRLALVAGLLQLNRENAWLPAHSGLFTDLTRYKIVTVAELLSICESLDAVTSLTSDALERLLRRLKGDQIEERLRILTLMLAGPQAQQNLATFIARQRQRVELLLANKRQTEALALLGSNEAPYGLPDQLLEAWRHKLQNDDRTMVEADRYRREQLGEQEPAANGSQAP